MDGLLQPDKLFLNTIDTCFVQIGFSSQGRCFLESIELNNGKYLSQPLRTAS